MKEIIFEWLWQRVLLQTVKSRNHSITVHIYKEVIIKRSHFTVVLQKARMFQLPFNITFPALVSFPCLFLVHLENGDKKWGRGGMGAKKENEEAHLKKQWASHTESIPQSESLTVWTLNHLYESPFHTKSLNCLSEWMPQTLWIRRTSRWQHFTLLWENACVTTWMK